MRTIKKTPISIKKTTISKMLHQNEIKSYPNKNKMKKKENVDNVDCCQMKMMKNKRNTNHQRSYSISVIWLYCFCIAADNNTTKSNL